MPCHRKFIWIKKRNIVQNRNFYINVRKNRRGNHKWTHATWRRHKTTQQTKNTKQPAIHLIYLSFHTRKLLKMVTNNNNLGELKLQMIIICLVHKSHDFGTIQWTCYLILHLFTVSWYMGELIFYPYVEWIVNVTSFY